MTLHLLYYSTVTIFPTFNFHMLCQSVRRNISHFGKGRQLRQVAALLRIMRCSWVHGCLVRWTDSRAILINLYPRSVDISDLVRYIMISLSHTHGDLNVSESHVICALQGVHFGVCRETWQECQGGSVRQPSDVFSRSSVRIILSNSASPRKMSQSGLTLSSA